MSILGEAHKHSPQLRDALTKIARSTMTGRDGMPLGTKKVIGYVCNIHTEGELAGTVDVQEYNCDPDEYRMEGVGHHEGVLLSAIQNNEAGYLIVPMLFSDVVLIQNPYDGQEYVIMYSHAKKMQLTTQSLKSEDDGEVKIGVTEVEDFVESPDGGQEKDYNELQPTKNAAHTTYTSKSITDKVTSPNDEKGFEETKTSAQKTIKVGDTEITIDGQNLTIKTSSLMSFQIGNAKITQEDGKVSIEVGGTTITEDSGNVQIDTQNCQIKGSSVTITGGTLKVQGQSSTDLMGPFNAIKACPFSGAPHCGSTVAGT